jgi:hypothetical protein
MIMMMKDWRIITPLMIDDPATSSVFTKRQAPAEAAQVSMGLPIDAA